MPELPEVETLCRQLNTVIAGKRIRSIEILDARLEQTSFSQFNSVMIPGLVGRQVVEVKRRGKYIRLFLEGGRTIEIHLRMSGRLLYLSEDAPQPHDEIPYRRLAMGFSSGTLLLLDPRRFATVTLRPGRIAPALPDDPLETFQAQSVREIARGRRLPVKSFLMDQRLIAGIGNIYACEILFAAGIDPRRPAGNLTADEWKNVSKAVPVVLSRAVDCRGTTVSDWRDLFGCSGTNQDHLRVYKRQGAACMRCGVLIERFTLGGRGTWFCPGCQK